jgi:hypothetical protein
MAPAAGLQQPHYIKLCLSSSNLLASRSKSRKKQQGRRVKEQIALLYSTTDPCARRNFKLMSAFDYTFYPCES